MNNMLNYLSFIHTRAVMKLKSQANTLVLSYLWWVLEPLLYVALFYFVFQYVLYRGGKDFIYFLVAGKIPFLWFSKAVSSAANSINENKGIIAQRAMSKIQFPLINCLEVFYKQIIAFAVMLTIFVFAGFHHFQVWWQLVPITAILFTLILGVAMLFSFFVTMAKDFHMILSLVMMGLMFTSGIFWDINMVQDEAIKALILTFNPLAALIDGYRQVLMHGELMQTKYLLTTAIWSIGLVVIGSTILSKANYYLTRQLFS